MDMALAAVVAIVLTAGALSAPETRPLDYLVILLGSLALAGWRRAPVAALVITTACMLCYAVRANPGPPAAFPVLITVYSTVRAGHRLPMVIAAVAFLGGTLAVSLANAAEESVQERADRTVLLLGWFLAAAIAGTASRHRQAYLQQVEQRATEADLATA